MIITRLIGGLGNQMFQYAAGRSLAYWLNTELKIDISKFKNYQLRHYSLSHFNLIENFASEKDLMHIKMSSSPVKNFLIDINCKLTGNIAQLYFKEAHFYYDPNFFKLTDNVYLDGYWQSEKYFAEIADILRKDFSFVTPPSAINQNLLEDIRGCNSVSMHIRRGDYVSNQSTMEIHGVLGIDYYVRALNLMGEKVKDPQIFVFSDDIPWAIEILKTNLPLQFIDHNGVEKNYEDLRLMSNCKNHIIANSSFSWWGAWLGSNSEKIVITPMNWFNQSNMDTRDLIPGSWYRI